MPMASPMNIHVITPVGVPVTRTPIPSAMVQLAVKAAVPRAQNRAFPRMPPLFSPLSAMIRMPNEIASTATSDSGEKLTPRKSGDTTVMMSGAVPRASG